MESRPSLASLQRRSQEARACSVEDIDFVVRRYVITVDVLPQYEERPVVDNSANCSIHMHTLIAYISVSKWEGRTKGDLQLTPFHLLSD